MNVLLGIKQEQSQTFLTTGKRIPVTQITVPGNTVMQIKMHEKNAYTALQLGIGSKKNASKPLLGHAKPSNHNTKDNKHQAPRFLKEARLKTDELLENVKVGDILNASDVFKEGDLINVIGISKGKGFAGGVKRHHFKGGPRTHGQSDRERAPGSIGQTTTPGRVYRGKRMAGRMGHERVTIKNLQVVKVNQDSLIIKGLIPGHTNSYVMVTKIGENKKFIPMYNVTVDPVNEQTSNPQEEIVIKSTQVEKDQNTNDVPQVENPDGNKDQSKEDASDEKNTEKKESK